MHIFISEFAIEPIHNALVLSSFIFKKVNRNVQGVPQSQTAANPRHQEEEKNDKN